MIGAPISAAAQATDTAAALPHVPPADTVAVESPLPGGVAELVRFMLNTVPSSVQIGGAILIGIVVIVGLVLVFRRRIAIRNWIAARPPGPRFAIVAVAVALLAGVTALGAATWNYTQHSNDFCVGCHVMDPAFAKFGNEENKHAELSCHDCHQQGIGASVRQLYVWVRERPEDIGEHAKVPNQICETCHVTGDTATWQHVAATAGHRVHLESDSSALADVQCVTCHGVEVHRFRPVRETCGQSGCHEPSETDIVLGKMAEQTIRHCTTCHEFTADVPALATTDSARGTLTPGLPECLGCHEMRQVLEDFDENRDPHGGSCGTCHNPHQQETPAQAAGTCASSGCHDDWRDEPFHSGENHRQVAERCLTCHEPHRSRVDASECAGCHTRVRERGRLRPPLPFDTTRALRRGAAGVAPDSTAATRRLGAAPAPIHRVPMGHRVSRGPSADDELSFEAAWIPEYALDPSQGISRPPPAPADTFSHARHANLACLVCHETGTGHGRLTFQPPRGCTICHHQAPATSRCSNCHQPEEVAAPVSATLTVSVGDREPRSRDVAFLHATHDEKACRDCHTTPVTLAPAPATAQCRDCHNDHHTVDRACSSCHAIEEPAAGHTSLQIAHTRCDACHTAETVARLTPTRTFCATCHADKAKDHYDQRQCTVCHFLAEPDAYRSHLITGRPG